MNTPKILFPSLIALLIVFASVGLTVAIKKAHPPQLYDHPCWVLIRHQRDLDYLIHAAEKQGDQNEVEALQKQYAKFRADNAIPDGEAACGMTWNNLLTI